LQKENIEIDSSYYLCSITQNQTSHSSHILDMAIKSLQHNLHKKDNKNMLLNMREIKHPLTLGHSIFPNSRWIVGQSRFKSVLCTRIFPTIKQQLQAITFHHTQ
jgi:hypothetical protein